MEEVECRYCGKVFKAEEKHEAKTKEGIHRSEEHVNDGANISKTGKDTNENKINDWKKNVEEDSSPWRT